MGQSAQQAPGGGTPEGVTLNPGSPTSSPTPSPQQPPSLGGMTGAPPTQQPPGLGSPPLGQQSPPGGMSFNGQQVQFPEMINYLITALGGRDPAQTGMMNSAPPAAFGSQAPPAQPEPQNSSLASDPQIQQLTNLLMGLHNAGGGQPGLGSPMS